MRLGRYFLANNFQSNNANLLNDHASNLNNAKNLQSNKNASNPNCKQEPESEHAIEFGKKYKSWQHKRRKL